MGYLPRFSLGLLASWQDADVVDAKLPRVAFFANRNIAPGEDLIFCVDVPLVYHCYHCFIHL